VVYNLLKPLLWRLETSQQRVFEWRLGVATGKVISKSNSDDTFMNNEDLPYQPCWWLPSRRVLRDLRPGSSDVLIDLGCGKGQILLIAAMLPLERVVGIDLDEELVSSAKRNIELARPHLKARTVECLARNVLDHPFDDDSTIVFMFNPFIGNTFRTAVSRIFESHDRRPRTLHIIYAFPWEHDWLIATGRVIVDNVRPFHWPTPPWWWRSGFVIVSYLVVDDVEKHHDEVQNPRRLFRPQRAIRRWSGTNDQRYEMWGPNGGVRRSHSQPGDHGV
jgi:SAM-dependent methyltransferase